MSSAFEAATGAFAVAGVADILYRMVHELCSFLGDVSDAPEEIGRLREVISETSILYHNSKRCQHDLATRSTFVSAVDVIASLESAAKALERELRDLTKTVKRYNGIRTWRNVKFVLGKDRVNKSIQRLEHGKTLLANALTLASIQLGGLGQTHVENIMRESYEDVILQTDRLSQALAATADTQHQDLLVLHNNHQIALKLKLENNQEEVISNQFKHEKKLATTQRTQFGILCRQNASMEVARRTQRQTSSILRTMTRAHARAVDVANTHAAIMTDLATDVKQLLCLNNGALLMNQSGREISFLGQHQERIIAYLLPFQDDVDFAIKYLISQHSEDISLSDAEFLCYEFQHLIDSAAQEKALQHPNSTAKSFDQWTYPGDTIGIHKDLSKRCEVHEFLHQSSVPKAHARKRTELPRKQYMQWSRSYTVQTSSGPMKIRIPHSQRAARGNFRDTVEVGISYKITQNGSSVYVNAHFLHRLAHAGEARICAQLNVFTLVDHDVSLQYAGLFQCVSLAGFDAALRKGTISPYHMSQYGDNLCLFFAAMYNRFDILDYLESQGIGRSALKHDSSFATGCWLQTLLGGVDFLESSFNIASEPSLFLLEASLRALLSMRQGTGLEQTLNACYELLRKSGLQLHDTPWGCLPRPQLLQTLIDLGAPIERNFSGDNTIGFLLWNLGDHRTNFGTAVDMLSILIEHGIDIYQIGVLGLTPSMTARYTCLWAEWCKALERNDLGTEDVLKKEGNIWLLENDWKKYWIDRRQHGWEHLGMIEHRDKLEVPALSIKEDDIADGEEEKADARGSRLSNRMDDPSTISTTDTDIENNHKISEHGTTE